MIDLELREALHALGIDEASRDVLALLPMVWVAWADGRLDPEEHAVLTEAASTRLKLSEDATRVLANWLAHAPTPAYLDRGCAVLLELGRRVDAGPDLPLDELCQAVAEAEGGVFGRVSRPEREALDHVARTLAIDPAVGWARVREQLHQRSTEMAWIDEEATVAGLRLDPLSPSRRGPPGLVMGSGSGEERVVDLGDAPITVGRGRGNTLQLAHDAHASRHHCVVQRREGRVWVKDLGSVNGTLVHGEQVVERELFGGESMLVGETVLLWRVGGA